MATLVTYVSFNHSLFQPLPSSTTYFFHPQLPLSPYHPFIHLFIFQPRTSLFQASPFTSYNYPTLSVTSLFKLCEFFQPPLFFSHLPIFQPSFSLSHLPFSTILLFQTLPFFNHPPLSATSLFQPSSSFSHFPFSTILF